MKLVAELNQGQKITGAEQVHYINWLTEFPNVPFSSDLHGKRQKNSFHTFPNKK